MLKHAIFSLIFIVCTATANAFEVLESVCKVHAGNAMGTGTCVDIYERTIFVFTNAHVVGNSTNVTCQFYRQGHESINVPGTVVWKAFRRDDSVDMAMIAIKADSLGGYLPKVIKFGDPSKTIPATSTVVTAGCPEGKWPALVKGHLIKTTNGVHYIKPPVENGRSGSALLDENENIIGIITWRSGDNRTGVGMAQDLQTIYAAMSGQIAARKIDHENDWWRLNGEFVPARPHRHLQEYHGPFFIQIQCPGGNCNPYGFSPFGGGQQPQGPSNPGQGGGGFSQGPNGSRLFPTLPPDPNSPGPGSPQLPPNGPSPQPQCPCPDPAELEGKFSDLNGKIADLDSKISKNETELGLIKDEQVIQNDQLMDLHSKYALLNDSKQPKGDYVTPGKLEDKLIEKNYVTPGKLEEYVRVDDVEKYKAEVSQDLKQLVDQTVVHKEEISNTTSILTHIQGILSGQGSSEDMLSLSSALGLGASLGTPVLIGLSILGWLVRKNGSPTIVLQQPANNDSGSGSTNTPFPTMTK